MISEKLYDNYLHQPTCLRNRDLVLVMPLYLGPEPKPMCTSKEYMHKSFDREFIKNHIIST
jgi:hypothetical protein